VRLQLCGAILNGLCFGSIVTLYFRRPKFTTIDIEAKIKRIFLHLHKNLPKITFENHSIGSGHICADSNRIDRRRNRFSANATLLIARKVIAPYDSALGNCRTTFVRTKITAPPHDRVSSETGPDHLRALMS
jgi:hypothetical protein